MTTSEGDSRRRVVGMIAQRGRSRNNETSKTKTESNKNYVPARAWFLNLNSWIMSVSTRERNN